MYHGCALFLAWLPYAMVRLPLILYQFGNLSIVASLANVVLLPMALSVLLPVLLPVVGCRLVPWPLSAKRCTPVPIVVVTSRRFLAVPC